MLESNPPAGKIATPGCFDSASRSVGLIFESAYPPNPTQFVTRICGHLQGRQRNVSFKRALAAKRFRNHSATQQRAAELDKGDLSCLT